MVYTDTTDSWSWFWRGTEFFVPLSVYRQRQRQRQQQQQREPQRQRLQEYAPLAVFPAKMNYCTSGHSPEVWSLLRFLWCHCGPFSLSLAGYRDFRDYNAITGNVILAFNTYKKTLQNYILKITQCGHWTFAVDHSVEEHWQTEFVRNFFVNIVEWED